jgi:hypothetical protein
MAPLALKTLLREKNVRVWNHIFKNGTSTPQNPNKSAAARSKEIRVLILWGTYNIADVRIRKIIFHNDL